METISMKIYRILADEIISGLLAPGQSLEEIALSERFQVSRTPIRQALRELSARGLIELRPRKGGVVVSISIDELADMLEAMCELEALCCRICAERMSAVQKKQLELIHLQAQECLERGDEDAYLELNKKFHHLISAGAHNKSLTDTMEHLRKRLAQFRAAQSGVEKRLSISHEEHEAIISAILASDAEKSYIAMRNHATRLSIHVLELIKERQILQADTSA
jgi:DNA-binding GntR family transcriptional regulator